MSTDPNTDTDTNTDDAYCAAQARRHDIDRYATALFAPAGARRALLALLAFNIEIARVREAVSEPMLGEIRLQWWREAIDGIYAGAGAAAPRRHQVVAPLADAVARFGLSRAHFDRLIDARAFDLGDAPPAGMAALVDYAEATSSTLVWLGLEALAVTGEAAREAGRHVGIAWALTGLLRAAPFHARARRQYLPADLMTKEGARGGDLFALRPDPALARVAAGVAATAHHHLDAARALRPEVPRAALPALLPAVLADAYLKRMARAGYDIFGKPVRLAQPGRQLRLAWAARRGCY